MKTADVTLSIELNERQLNQAKLSLKKTKKRLHDAELTLSVEPKKEEKVEYQQWKDKVHQLIEERMHLDFPTFAQIRQEAADRDRSEKEESSRHTIKPAGLPPQSLQRLLQSRENKRYGETNYFGPKTAGQLIGEVKNYGGVNSIYTTVRPIVRKDCKDILGQQVSSLPPWIGPMHYDNADPSINYIHRDEFYQVAFVSQGRYTTSADEIKAKIIAKRDARLHSRKNAQEPQQILPNLPEENSEDSIKSDLIKYKGNSKKSATTNRQTLQSISVDRPLSSFWKTELPVTETSNLGGMHANSRSLQQKMSRGKPTHFRVKDYTMNALCLQTAKKEKQHETFYVEHDDESLMSKASAADGGEESSVDPTLPNKQSQSSVRKQLSAAEILRIRDVDEALQDFADLFSPSPDKEDANNHKSNRHSAAPVSEGGEGGGGLSTASASPSPSATPGGVKPRLGKKSSSQGLSVSTVMTVSLPALSSDDRSKDRPPRAVGAVGATLGAISRRLEAPTTASKANKSSILNAKTSVTSKSASAAQLPTVTTGAAVTILKLPLEVDVKPQLRKWASETDIYSPIKPHTVKFLKEHRSMSPVNISGLLLRKADEFHRGAAGIDMLMGDLGIDDAYFSVSKNDARPAESEDDAADWPVD